MYCTHPAALAACAARDNHAISHAYGLRQHQIKSKYIKIFENKRLWVMNFSTD